MQNSLTSRTPVGISEIMWAVVELLFSGWEYWDSTHLPWLSPVDERRVAPNNPQPNGQQEKFKQGNIGVIYILTYAPINPFDSTLHSDASFK